MAMDRDITTAHTPDYIFSDTCKEAILDIKAFLRSSPPQDYTRGNADRVIANTLRNNHDPSETLWNDRDQCRFGRTMGILLFIREELEAIQEALSAMLPCPGRKTGSSRSSLWSEPRWRRRTTAWTTCSLTICLLP
jgi:hypothetical protein